MSIIHDALKKVQQTNPSTSLPGPAANPPPAPPPPARTEDRVNIPLLVAAGCAVIAMIFAALPRIMPGKAAAPATVVAPVTAAPAAPATTKTTRAQTISVSKAIAEAIATASTPAPAPTPAPVKITDPNDPFSGIQIEGVMDMGGKKAALINGNVYEEGQTIYERIITQITFETLTIIDNGQKRTFRVKP